MPCSTAGVGAAVSKAALTSPTGQRPTSSAGLNPLTRAKGAGKGQRGATATPALADSALLPS
ncbi:MAG: hypothetical protein RBT70_10165 [Alphaproteobacteria bacterium]|nr:hypothetical protein [Alphaproteobacteria bacterium]